MSGYVDLSHTIEEDISVFKTLPAPRIYPYFTHEESRASYNDKSMFEVTTMEFQTSCGTYMDSPYHRYPEGKDISRIGLEQTILEGVVVDVSDKGRKEPIVVGDIPHNRLDDRAVLFYTGWDRWWKKEEYHQHPYLSREAAEFLLEKGVKLVGIDTINIDNPQDDYRPVHTLLLKNDILIVENLCNLAKLIGRKFTFFACPLKVKKAAAFPVRAFATVD
ncbi:MAG: cyclase family protein [Archaeoglobaceae archaeon]